jgi:hypothetical protein
MHRYKRIYGESSKSMHRYKRIYGELSKTMHYNDWLIFANGSFKVIETKLEGKTLNPFQSILYKTIINENVLRHKCIQMRI